MRVVFLGTGGFHPNERRHTLCVMLPEIGLLLDAGTSVFRVADRLQTDELDIFLTHAHLDHIAGLTFLLVPMLDGRVRQARLHGRPETLEAVRRHLFSERVFPVLPGYEHVQLEDEVPVGRDGMLRSVPLVHPGGSVGFRIDWPECSLAYITDTTVDGSYTEFVRGVDLLIHECYFLDGDAEWSAKTGHSNTTPVAELARDAQVGQLVLVHMDPSREEDDLAGLEAARKVFPQTQFGEDLMEIEI